MGEASRKAEGAGGRLHTLSLAASPPSLQRSGRCSRSPAPRRGDTVGVGARGPTCSRPSLRSTPAGPTQASFQATDPDLGCSRRPESQERGPRRGGAGSGLLPAPSHVLSCPHVGNTARSRLLVYKHRRAPPHAPISARAHLRPPSPAGSYHFHTERGEEGTDTPSSSTRPVPEQTSSGSEAVLIQRKLHLSKPSEIPLSDTHFHENSPN